MITIDDNFKWSQIKQKRDRLLSESLWTQLEDAPLSKIDKELWFNYRKILHNIRPDNTDPDFVIFPEPPVSEFYNVKEIRITSSSNVIIGDGIDEILLSVTGEPGALLVIDTLCGGTIGSISIQLDEAGNGSQVFSCETSPNVITFSCGDVLTKVRAL